MTTRKAKTTTETVVTETIPSTLQVTHVQVYPLKEPVGKTKAMVRVVLGDHLQLTGMRLVDGVGGLFLAYPNDPGYKGDDYRSLFYPVTRELREHIEQKALKAFEEALAA